MYVLVNISFLDLVIICLITAACIFTMIGIIIFSSKTTDDKSNENVKIKVVEKAPSFHDETFKEEKKIEKVQNRKEEQKQEPLKEKPMQIEDVLSKMEQEIEKGPSENTHSFEQLQEEKAIISYKELLKVAGKLKDENEKTDDELEKKKIPNIKEITSLFYEEEHPLEEKIQEQKKVPKEEPKVEKKFKSSEIISPVYGRISNNTNSNNKFLDDLKDLRKNLE